MRPVRKQSGRTAHDLNSPVEDPGQLRRSGSECPQHDLRCDRAGLGDVAGAGSEPGAPPQLIAHQRPINVMISGMLMYAPQTTGLPRHHQRPHDNGTRGSGPHTQMRLIMAQQRHPLCRVRWPIATDDAEIGLGGPNSPHVAFVER